MTRYRTDADGRGVTVDVDWKTRAKCREYPPDLWFNRGARAIAQAVAVCRECPVRRDCGRHAILVGEQRGIAAGFRLDSAKARASLRSWLGIAAPPSEHVCGKCGQPMDNRRLCRGLCRGCRTDVPSQPVLDHIRALRAAGRTTIEIAASAGMSLARLKKIIYGDPPPQYISPKNRDQLLAVPVPEQARS